MLEIKSVCASADGLLEEMGALLTALLSLDLIAEDAALQKSFDSLWESAQSTAKRAWPEESLSAEICTL